MTIPSEFSKALIKHGVTTVVTDHHEIANVARTNDEDMLLAIQEIEYIQGGLVVMNNGEVFATVPLHVGGIMSEKPYQETIHELTTYISN